MNDIGLDFSWSLKVKLNCILRFPIYDFLLVLIASYGLSWVRQKAYKIWVTFNLSRLLKVKSNGAVVFHETSY